MKHVALFVSLLLAARTHAQWQNLGSGITNTPRKIFSISAVDENTVWAVAYNPNGAAAYDFTMTTDGGTGWNAGTLPNVGAYYPGQIHALNDQTAWVLMIKTIQQDRIKILKTTDGGANWVDQPGEFNLVGFGFAGLHFFNANEGIGFGSPGTGDATIDSLRIYRTADGGSSWSRIPAADLPDPEAGEGQWIFGDNRYESKGDTLWFGTRAGRLWRTTDKGNAWQAFTTGLMGSVDVPGLASMAFENHLRGIVTSYSPSQAARTEDGGETWTPITMPTNPPAGDIVHVPGTASTYFVNEGLLNPSNSSSPYLITHDGGDTWHAVTFTPAVPVIEFLSPTAGFGGGDITSPTQGGIYGWVGGHVGFHDPTADGAEPMAFPNPSDGTFILPVDQRSALVHVQVMDATGRVVWSEQLAASNGRVSVHASGIIPSGCYVVSAHDGLRTRQAQLIIR